LIHSRTENKIDEENKNKIFQLYNLTLIKESSQD